MDEIVDRQVPNSGRFCGVCFARLARDTERCPYCATERRSAQTVESVRGRRSADLSREEAQRGTVGVRGRDDRTAHRGGRVRGAGGVGTDLVGSRSIALGIAFLALIGGGYLLAQLFGPLICGQVGYRQGSRKRDELWGAFLEERKRGEAG